MGNMLNIGIFISILGALASIIGVITLLIGIDESRNEDLKKSGKMKKARGLKLMAFGAVSLLLSFALCTA